MRNRSVFAPTNDTKSPCRFQVPASVSAAINSSSACARSGGQGRFSIAPSDEDHGVARPPKTGPCRPCTRVRAPPRRHRRFPGWDPLRSRHAVHIELHFRSERKAVIGQRRGEMQGGGDQQERSERLPGPCVRMKSCYLPKNTRPTAPRAVLLRQWRGLARARIHKFVPVGDVPRNARSGPTGGTSARPADPRPRHSTHSGPYQRGNFGVDTQG